MRLGADAYDWTQIPRSYNARGRLVLGYDEWPAEAWEAFPLATKVRIATSAEQNGLQYCVLDVERYDATVAQAPGWLERQHAIGALWPTFYVEESGLASLRGQLARWVPGLAYSVWVAWWDHPVRVPGCVGQQMGPVSGAESWDLSFFWDATWQDR